MHLRTPPGHREWYNISGMKEIVGRNPSVAATAPGIEINEACQNAMENIPLSTLFCKSYYTLLASLLSLSGAIILQVIYWKISSVAVHLKAVALNLSPDYSVIFLAHKLRLLIQINYYISRC